MTLLEIVVNPSPRSNSSLYYISDRMSHLSILWSLMSRSCSLNLNSHCRRT